jgi:hypothetical protein
MRGCPSANRLATPHRDKIRARFSKHDRRSYRKGDWRALHRNGYCQDKESDVTMIERVARAIESAQCLGREGPYGGYDYGCRNKKPVEGGRYVVRDFRDPASSNWGAWVHQTDNRDDHEEAHKRLTKEHIARVAIEAMRDPSPAMIDRFVSRALQVDANAEGWSKYAEEQWKTMIDAALEELS